MRVCRDLVVACLMCFPLFAAGEEPDLPVVEGWGKFVDPDNDCKLATIPSEVSIRVPGTPHGLSAELNRMNAPRLLNDVQGEFVAEVTVKGGFAPGEATIIGRTSYNGAGLLLMQDPENYIRLERAVLVRGGQPTHYANFRGAPLRSRRTHRRVQ